MQSRTWLLPLILTVSACGPKIMVNGIEVYEKQWSKAVTELRPRASVELGCSGDELDFQLLHLTGRIPSEVAAAGCNRLGVYARAVVRGGNGTLVGAWSLSSLRDNSVAAAPQTATPEAAAAQTAPPAETPSQEL